MRRPRAERGRSWRLLLSAIAPWSWFLVRDAGVALDAAATLLPLAVTLIAGATFGRAWRSRCPRLGLVGTSWAAMGAAAVVGPWIPAGGPTPVHPIRVVEANIDYINPERARGLADIVAQNGDVVVVTEVLTPDGPNRHGEDVERLLAASYAFSASSPEGDPVVFSRFPVRLLGFVFPEVAVRFELSSPDGRAVIVASHPHRPHLRKLVSQFAAHRAGIESVRSAVIRERVPVLVVGDLNLSDRMHTYRRLTGAGLRDAMRANWAGPTYAGWPSRLLLLRIDHIFVSRSWCAAGARWFRIAGSDHRGITALVGPCPQTTVVQH